MKIHIKIAALILGAIFLFITALNTAAASITSQTEQTLREELIANTAYNNAVEPYRETVTLYCQTYTMTDYINIIMKMLSVYSATHTTDILNSSFSYLNTKYEHKNEGITDTEYSIKTGIAQLSEWEYYITSKYNSKPIENNNSLLILLQAYELQDRTYIDYAFSGSGYSSSDIASYCSGSSCQSKKSISNINCSFASDVINMNFSSSSISSETMNEQQKKIIELALDFNNYSKNGVKAKGGNCLSFTNDILSAAGLPIKRADCARCAGDYFGVNNDWGSIPVGAEIYCLASQQYGHVGIYIGDGYVVHCTTYKNSGSTLLKTVPGGYVIKQPLTSFISSYKAKCWGFSGAWSDKYPYKTGKYMRGLH